MDFSLPTTTSRVTRNTSRKINERIRAQAVHNVERYCGADQETLARRLEELDREWDLERVLQTGASLNVLFGLTMGTFVNRRWYSWSAIVASFLLLQALEGWAPPLPILRRLGFRTQAEIEEERDALRILRGDFHETSDPRDALAQSRLSLASTISGTRMTNSK